MFFYLGDGRYNLYDPKKDSVDDARVEDEDSLENVDSRLGDGSVVLTRSLHKNASTKTSSNGRYQEFR